MKRILISSLLILSGCATAPKDLTSDHGTLAEGDRLRDDEFFEEARAQYTRIKTEFPASNLQLQADLKIAETYFLEESYPAAASAYEDFIRTYPGRAEVPLALSQLGLCYLRQMPNTPQRDTRATIKVVDVFTRIMIDYPDSPYAKEAQKHIEFARNQLAEKIFEIAKFYEKTKEFSSAAKRYEEVQSQYPDSKFVEEAMARQIHSLRKAGKPEVADSLTKDFQEKFPKSEFMSMITP